MESEKSGESRLDESTLQLRLARKYSQTMYFFKVKQINQILSMESKFPSYMDHCDAKIMAEDIEYLKRMYYYRTYSGKPELDQRMKLISQHYSTNPRLSTFTYEYPMMIVTGTKSLFLRRKRRLRKIQAGQGSSDDTQEREEEFGDEFSFPTQYFLDQMENSLFSDKSEEESEVSYDSDPHNVYEDYSSEQGQPSSLEAIDLKAISESQLGSLVEDHHQSQASRSTFKGTGKSKVDDGFAALHNLQNMTSLLDNHRSRTVKESAIQILPIEDRLELQKQQKDKKTGALTGYVDLLLSRPINFTGLGLGQTYENPTAIKYSTLVSTTDPKSIQQEQEQRAAHRKRIKEKAEELLRRVRAQEVMVQQG